MRFNIKSILLTIVIFAMSASTSALAASQTGFAFAPVGAVKISPPENVFYVGGKGFVMLDSVEGENGGIFCISCDSYGNANIDNWGQPANLNLEKENNLLFRMNKALFKESEDAQLEALPDEIIKKTDRNHKWFCDRGRTFGDFEITCGVNLLSIDEYKKYVNLIGVNDKDFTSWWTRSPYIPWDDFYITLGASPAGKTAVAGHSDKNQVRPCFWLDSDFFESTKLDSYRMGSNIKKMLISFGDEKLSELGYSKEEIEEIKQSDTDISEFFSIELPDMPDTWYGVKSFDFDVNIELQSKEQRSYKVKVFIDGKVIHEKDVTVPAQTLKKITLNTGEMTNAKHKLKAEVYFNEKLLWEDSKSFDVIQEYEPQFMEEYTAKGFNHHISNLRFLLALKEPAAQYKLMRRVGSTAQRDGYEWPSFEQVKKMYLWNNVSLISDMAAQPGPLQMTFGYNNYLYSDRIKKGGDNKYTPVTKENIDNYSEYISETMKRFKGVDYPMIWNEPIGDGFWKPGKDVPSYSMLVMASVGLAKNALGTDVKTNWTVGSATLENMKDLVEKGGYSYFDVWTTGTYQLCQKIDTREMWVEYLNKGAGGWKDLTAYEFGGSTNVGGDYTEKEQAALIPVQMMLYDDLGFSMQAIYQFNNFGLSTTEREENFGVVDAYSRAKPALYSIAAHFRLLNGAKFLGRCKRDNLYSFYYYKDGKVIEVDYVNKGTKAVNIAGKEAYDLYGNKITPVNNEIVVAREPVYIFGNKKDEALNGILSTVRSDAEFMYDYYANLMGKERKYNSFDTFTISPTVTKYANEPQEFEDCINVHEEDAYGFEIIGEELENEFGKFYAMTQNGIPEENEIKNYLNEYYDLGNKFIRDYKDGRIHMSTREFSGFLYSMHKIGEKIANVYMMTVPQNEADPKFATGVFAEIQNVMKKNESEVVGGIYEYSTSMLHIAEKYVNEAANVSKMKESNPQKAGVIASRNLIGEKIVDWVKEFMDLEGVSHRRIVLQMTRANRKFYNFSENEAIFSLYNFGKKDFSGKIEFYDSEGTQLFTTPATVKGNDSTEVKCKFDLQNTTENRTLYTVKLISGDEVWYEEDIDDIELAETAVVKLVPSDVPVEHISTVNVSVENTFNQKMDYTVKLETPEDWTLANNEKTVSVAPGQTREVSFEVSEKKTKDFNEYYFNVVLSSNGTELVNQKDIPLQFLYVPKAKSAIDIDGFNGDISSWRNTYPVMVSVPKEPSNPKSWQSSSASLKMYTQWDSSALYILAVVYDDMQLNDKLGALMWNGDSIQLSIDTDHTKTGSYDSGDLELGFALTDSGLQNHAWTGESEAFNNMSYSIIRNNDDNTTKYLLRIPKEALKSMKLESGYIFGMNVVLNDADTVARTYWDELTFGTGYSKSPSYYYDWILGK